MDDDHGENRENGRGDREGGRGDKIGVGGGDDAVTRIQLAARWSESFAPEGGDSLVGILKRFRVAYEYLDAVIHGVEPAEPEMPEPNARAAQPAPAPTPAGYSAPSPPPPPPGSEPEGQSEQRPW